MKRATKEEAVVVGERIRARRHAMGLTGDEIHALTGIHPARLSQIEHGYGEPTGPQLRALARVLGTSLDDLGGIPAPAGKARKPGASG